MGNAKLVKLIPDDSNILFLLDIIWLNLTIWLGLLNLNAFLEFDCDPLFHLILAEHLPMGQSIFIPPPLPVPGPELPWSP